MARSAPTLFANACITNKPPRFLGKPQIEALPGACDGTMRRFCTLSIYAGLRRGEIIAAQWEWFDFGQGTITVQPVPALGWTPKGERHRIIPLHNRLREGPGPVKKETGPLWHKENLDTLRVMMGKWFRGTSGAVGFDGVTPRVLRHTFSSQLVQAGVSLLKVSQWLGHAKITGTQICAHLASVDSDIGSF